MNTRPPLKVLHVIGSLGMGGAETWLMEVLRLWKRDGTGQMDFLLTSGTRGVFDDEAVSLGARIYNVPYSRRHLVRFAQQFRKVLGDGSYDAIHDHADYASGWHLLFGLGKMPPVRVVHVHNPWLHIESNYAVTRSRKLAARLGKRLVDLLATHVCGTSADVLKRYGFLHSRVSASVVHCGFDVTRFNASRDPDRESVRREFGWRHDAIVVLLAGRLDRALELNHPQNHKNSWFAVNVVRAAIEKNPSIRLIAAGDGDAVELNRRIREWGLTDELRIVGIRRDLPRLMRGADVLFFPSTQEGLGMVAVEAQAAGTPVMASTSVPRECVVIGDLYDAMPLTDSIDRWADALLLRIQKPRPTIEFCRRAMDVSPFAIGTSVRRLEEIYRAMPSEA